MRRRRIFRRGIPLTLLWAWLSLPASGQIPPPPELATGETLEIAWQVALQADQQLDASRWNLAAAQSTWQAARAERFPSLKIGGDYYALSQKPVEEVSFSPLPVTVHVPLFDQDSVGFHTLVTQPIYTSGRISSGIRAAESAVQANEADVQPCGWT